MKIAFCLAALVAVTATSAFAQDSGAVPKASIYYKPTGSQSPEAISLADMIRKALDDSRDLDVVPMTGDGVMELDGPLKITKDADGKKMTVTYEISQAHGTERSYSATCTVTQMDRCADAIVLRAERASRETAERKLF